MSRVGVQVRLAARLAAALVARHVAQHAKVDIDRQVRLAGRVQRVDGFVVGDAP